MITKKQADLLENIKAFISDNNYSPTVAELAEIEGVKPNATHNRLEQLRKKGYIDWKDGQSRTLHVADKDKG